MPVRVAATVTREGTWYVARCLEIDVASQGETIEQALSNLCEAWSYAWRTNRSRRP
jgi:predicted RNase H-like HicB family nuclease